MLCHPADDGQPLEPVSVILLFNKRASVWDQPMPKHAKQETRLALLVNQASRSLLSPFMEDKLRNQRGINSRERLHHPNYRLSPVPSLTSPVNRVTGFGPILPFLLRLCLCVSLGVLLYPPAVPLTIYLPSRLPHSKRKVGIFEELVVCGCSSDAAHCLINPNSGGGIV